MKKKMVALFMGTIMIMTVVTGCTNESKKTDTKKAEYAIGISQFAEHGSLENCKEGFVEGLKEEGLVEGENLKIIYKNAAADMGTAGQIADGFVGDKVDLICGIATPSAQTSYNAAMEQEIPVIFTAITDPIAAELAKKDGTPVGEITGTSDKLPIEAQLKMIREIMPTAKKIGIMYTTSEVNSISAIEEYKEKVKDFGFTLETVGISTAADVSLAADELINKVDCITNLTDNTVVSSLTTILDKANEKNIPIFGSEIEQVKIGCLAAAGLDYIKLGKQTGKMAAQILKGEKKASEMSFETISESEVYLNKTVADKLKIKLSEELIGSASEAFDTIGK